MHTHAFFGDYTGDCQADLVLLGPDQSSKNQTRCLLQFAWGEKDYFRLHEDVKIEEQIQHFTIQDISKSKFT